MRIFTIKGSLFSYHLDIVPDDTSPVVHIRRRAMTGTTPLLTMHDGPDENRPVLAVSHLPHFSKNFKIGLGDARGPPDDLRWEDMIMANSGVKHRWAVDLSAPDGAAEQRRSFCWTRTKHVVVEGMHKPMFSAQNYKLTEEGREGNPGDAGGGKEKDIVAVFTGSLARGQLGRLQINVDYGRDFDVMVWMTCLTVYWAGR